MRKSIEERFWPKVKIGDPTECWEWQASITPNGYGQFMWPGKTRRAHRASWILANGEIPDGMCILHTCDNPACCNPAHLWLGTQSDNVRDMYAKGRAGIRVGVSGTKQALERGVRYLYTNGNFSPEALAEIFGISVSTIWRYIKQIKMTKDGR